MQLDVPVTGILEHPFEVGDVPGVLWTPPGPVVPRPLVLIGHGGGQHRLAPPTVGRARLLVAAGMAAAAIDAPGHGDRPRSAQDEQFGVDLRRRMAAGEPVGPLLARSHAQRADAAVPEWRSVLSALQARDDVDAAGIGYWGVSMGGAIGVPLLAAEPRITAAVIGLVGDDGLTGAAARIAVPVLFLLQWDDEVVPRDAALALFGALGSADKCLHANPGSHAGVPEVEREAAVGFLRRHLLAPAATAG